MKWIYYKDFDNDIWRITEDYSRFNVLTDGNKRWGLDGNYCYDDFLMDSRSFSLKLMSEDELFTEML